MIKNRGDFSGAAGDIAPRTPAYVDGPHGNFMLEGRPCRSIALFAGGIGIAPLLGILRDLQLRGDRRPVRLVYGTRNAGRLVGMDVIDAARQGLDLRVDCVLEEPPPGWTGEVGAISPAVVARAIAGLEPGRCLCLLCGPAPMMLAVERVLLGLGVPGGNIVFERFDYA
jgi:ferredoxin-NADP reductase